ncbi:MAG TPA: NAD(P)H-dependent oxidoreductase [Steroidobacteraceae bacterium]|nr:NAD(P)H-dependent oxidoreductase [Steroidobacteraceae bacterium]
MSEDGKRILILDGHPDPAPQRFVHALAEAYEQGALEAGFKVQRIRVADLEFPILRSKADYERGKPSDSIYPCLDAFEWASHVVILYPLWLGSTPALLKALLEQIIRPGFAFSTGHLGTWPIKYLRGRSVRLVVTMGMSELAFRFRFGAGSTGSLESVLLATSGLRALRTIVIGSAERLSSTKRKQWLAKLKTLGYRGR